MKIRKRKRVIKQVNAVLLNNKVTRRTKKAIYKTIVKSIYCVDE